MLIAGTGFFLLQVSNYTLPMVLAIGAVFSVATCVATWLLVRNIYRTGLPTRQAEQWKANYEAEHIRAEAACQQRDEAQEKIITYERERGIIALEFSQLSQLFAKKSIILESLTSEYGHLADLAGEGKAGEFLRARLHPIADEEENIHSTASRNRHKR